MSLIDAAIAAMDAGLRKVLAIELVGVSGGVPKSRLTEIMAPLRPQRRHIVAQMPIETSTSLRSTESASLRSEPISAECRSRSSSKCSR